MISPSIQMSPKNLESLTTRVVKIANLGDDCYNRVDPLNTPGGKHDNHHVFKDRQKHLKKMTGSSKEVLSHKYLEKNDSYRNASFKLSRGGKANMNSTTQHEKSEEHLSP